MEITKRQKAVLEKIYNFIKKHSYSPSVRDIASVMGFSSPKAASDHMRSLEKKGYITRNSLARSVKLTEKAYHLFASPGHYPAVLTNSVPVLGRIAAGNPIFAEENIEEYISVPESFLGAYSADFALKVKGNSMTGDHILDKDTVMVKSQNAAENGEIVVALIAEEAVVKRFYKFKNIIELRSSNPDYPPIIIRSMENSRESTVSKNIDFKNTQSKNDKPADIKERAFDSRNFKILGKVIAVYRNM